LSLSLFLSFVFYMSKIRKEEREREEERRKERGAII
jgi:hypothetical protein